MTRWLIVAGDFTPLGGMDAANHALAGYLAARGDVHLVTHRAWPDLASLPSVTLHQVPRPLGKHALGSALLSRAGRRVWRQLRPSGVHAVVNGGNCRLAAANWVHYLHAAYVPSIAGSLLHRSKVSLTHRRDLADERMALREARIVICNSHRTRDDVIAQIGVEAAKAHVVYYGSDPIRFGLVGDAERIAAKSALGAAPDRPLVGFIGALGDRRKAFDTVFDAWRTLCARSDWDATLMVVGAGAELAAWRRRASDAGIADRFCFAGFRQDVPAILAALDGLVHPARYEAYGLSVHEAICRGVPAIVSATAGIAELYPTELADLLVRDPNDAGELAERLTMWRRNLARLRMQVLPFSGRLRAHTWDSMAARIAELVEQADAA